MTTNLLRQGKVRDIYDAGDYLLLVASDRVSAFDWVIPTEIPDKGRVLTQISNFWFDRIDVPNHLVKLDLQQLEVPRETSLEQLEGRGILVKKCEVVPIECVVRGYLAGSGWREYRKDQTVCGLPLPDGLENGSQLPEPVFTPATNARLDKLIPTICQPISRRGPCHPTRKNGIEPVHGITRLALPCSIKTGRPMPQCITQFCSSKSP